MIKKNIASMIVMILIIIRRVWKIQINMHVSFISSRDAGETGIYYVWSDNVSIIQGQNTNAIIRKTLFYIIINKN